MIDEGRGTVLATMSDESRDRDGDVIRANGWNLDDFLAHPVLLSSHNYGSLMQQIGKWNNVTSIDGKLTGEAEYFIGSGNNEADWGFELVRRNQAAYSVGFIPGEMREMRGGGIEFVNGHKLLETSHVTVPSNPAALQQMAHAIKGMPGMLPVMEIIEEMAHAQLDEVKSVMAGRTDIKEVSGDLLMMMNAGMCLMPECDMLDTLIVALCRHHIAAFYELAAYGESDDPEMLPSDDAGMYAPGAFPVMTEAKAEEAVAEEVSTESDVAEEPVVEEPVAEEVQTVNPVVVSLDLEALLTRSFAEVR